MKESEKVHMMSKKNGENVLCGSKNIYKYTTYTKELTCVDCKKKLQWKTCFKCGVTVNDNERICHGCGATLIEAV